MTAAISVIAYSNNRRPAVTFGYYIIIIVYAIYTFYSGDILYVCFMGI